MIHHEEQSAISYFWRLSIIRSILVPWNTSWRSHRGRVTRRRHQGRDSLAAQFKRRIFLCLPWSSRHWLFCRGCRSLSPSGVYFGALFCICGSVSRTFSRYVTQAMSFFFTWFLLSINGARVLRNEIGITICILGFFREKTAAGGGSRTAVRWLRRTDGRTPRPQASRENRGRLCTFVWSS